MSSSEFISARKTFGHIVFKISVLITFFFKYLLYERHNTWGVVEKISTAVISYGLVPES